MRLGTIEAPNRDTAFAVLLQRKLRVLELREDTTAEIVVESSPGLSARQPRLKGSSKATHFAPAWRNHLEKVCLVLAVVGLLGFLATYQRPDFGSSAKSGAEKNQNFRIRGPLPGTTSEGLVIEFQEIPLTFRPASEQIELAGDGTFEANFSLVLEEEPTKFKVRCGKRIREGAFVSTDSGLVGEL